MTTSPLRIEVFVEPSFGENAYVLSCPDAQGQPIGWIVDPGFPPTVHDLLAYVRREGLRIERIILTHGHLDHIAGVDEVRRAHPAARIALAADEQDALADPEKNLSSQIGLPVTLSSRADDDLPVGGEIQLGPTTWRILDVSGHSPAGRALYCPEVQTVLVGDALFSGSIGRYDFPGSDGRRLIRNIRQNLLNLPGETAVLSGHGPKTNIENERKSNPFLSDDILG